MRRAGVWLIALMLLLVVPTPSFAKALVVRGGLSIAWVSGEFEFFDPEDKLGFAGAVGFELPLHPRVSMTPEVGYAMRGFSAGESEITGPGGNPTGTFETLFATDYVTVGIPVSLRFPTSNVGFSLSTGPQVAFEVSEATVLRGDREDEIDSEASKDTDFCWLVGAAADLPFGRGQAGVEVRYVHGLVNLNDIGPEEFSTRALEILATWKFPLGQ
jgi:hypothetical protein